MIKPQSSDVKSAKMLSNDVKKDSSRRCGNERIHNCFRLTTKHKTKSENLWIYYFALHRGCKVITEQCGCFLYDPFPYLSALSATWWTGVLALLLPASSLCTNTTLIRPTFDRVFLKCSSSHPSKDRDSGPSSSRRRANTTGETTKSSILQVLCRLIPCAVRKIEFRCSFDSTCWRKDWLLSEFSWKRSIGLSPLDSLLLCREKNCRYRGVLRCWPQSLECPQQTGGKKMQEKTIERSHSGVQRLPAIKVWRRRTSSHLTIVKGEFWISNAPPIGRCIKKRKEIAITLQLAANHDWTYSDNDSKFGAIKD